MKKRWGSLYAAFTKKVIPQGLRPGSGLFPEKMGQLVAVEDGKGGTAGLLRPLGTGDGFHPAGIARKGNRLAGQFAPAGATAVGSMPEARLAAFGQQGAPEGKVKRIGGGTVLIVHHADDIAPPAGVQNGLDEIPASRAEQPGRAQHKGTIRQNVENGLLPGQFGFAVDREGMGRILLGEGAVMVAAENEVRAVMDELSGSHVAENAGKGIRQGAVDEHGILGMIFRIIHLRPGDRIEYGIGLDMFEPFLQEIHVQQIAVAASQRRHLPAARGKHPDKGLTQQTGCASKNQRFGHDNLRLFMLPPPLAGVNSKSARLATSRQLPYTAAMKCAILLVAFGAAGRQAQEALRGVDAQVRTAFPGLPVRWAYTSHLLRERLALARQKSDSVLKALRRLQFEGFRQVAVQPLQSIPGDEYGEVRAVLEEVAVSSAMRLELGTPLLNDEADVEAAAQAVLAHLPAERRPDEDVVLMGHGARHPAMSRYEALARAVRARDTHIHVGAMSGPLELEALLPALVSRRVWLLPLLSVVGRHALEDMAGEAESSWRSRLERAGHECCPILRGMAEYRGFAAIWLRHLAQAVARLDGRTEGA